MGGFSVKLSILKKFLFFLVLALIHPYPVCGLVGLQPISNKLSFGRISSDFLINLLKRFSFSIR